MVICYKKWKKYNEIQLTKNKMDFSNRKMTNHPPSPGFLSIDNEVHLHGNAVHTSLLHLRIKKIAKILIQLLSNNCYANKKCNVHCSLSSKKSPGMTREVARILSASRICLPGTLGQTCHGIHYTLRDL